jgi:hypothetical protein
MSAGMSETAGTRSIRRSACTGVNSIFVLYASRYGTGTLLINVDVLGEKLDQEIRLRGTPKQ